MRYFRVRVVLLSLGVVLGYGSSLAHLMHVRSHGGHGYWDCAPFDASGPRVPAPKLQ